MKKDFTAAVYILFEEKILLLYHKKLKKWLPPGGHLEPNETPPEAARREVREETNLEINFLRQENVWVNRWNANSFERPYLCLLEEIPAHGTTPAHQHIDFVYLAEPIDPQNTFSSDTEIKWFRKIDLETLIPDVDIYIETLEIITHLFESIKESLKT